MQDQLLSNTDVSGIRYARRDHSTKRQILRIMASCFSVLAVGAVLTSHSFAAPPQMGINIGGIADYDSELLFADAMKESRTWDSTSGSGSLSTSSLDANGWPNQDAQIYVWAGSQSNMAGTYALSFSGKATVTLLNNGGTITGQSYNSSTNVTTATVNALNSDCVLRFTNTQQTATSATNTGIKNITLMRPTAPGATTSYIPGTLFTNQAKNLFAKFSTLRFMDYLATNQSPVVNWSDRTQPGFYSQQHYPTNHYSDHVTGGSWEYIVQLANQTGKDIWINIPLKATDDYVTKVAQLLRYGSDGTNPYTTTQASPVYAPLNSSIHVYVEYANEVWNTGGPFDGNTNHTLAQQEVAAGGSPLNFDGDTNDWDWAWRRTAKRSKEISDLFRTVWGSANMMSTIRPVMESQLGYYAGPLLQEMHMMQDYYNTSRAGTPHPPSYYFYGGGGSAYYNPDNSGTWDINSVWTSQTFNTATWLSNGILADVNYIVPSLGRRTAYEGGPSLDRTGASVDSLKEQVWGDSRMTTTLSQHQVVWDQSGGDLLVYYQSLGDYQWGFTHDVNNLSTAKLTAINNLNATTKSVGTNGTAIPATLAASSYVAPETWAGANIGNMAASGSWTWTSYVVKVGTASGFNIGLHAGSVGTGNTAEIYVDGVSCGTITVTNTGSNSTYASTGTVTSSTLAAGTHGIVVKARSGSFGFDQVLVTTGTGGGGGGGTTTYTAKLFPRANNASRLIGGKIQGSNNNTTWTDLATVTTATEGQWQTLNIGTTNYRYWRYLGADGTWGNVAEVEFDNNGVNITGTGFGTPGSWQNQGNTFDKALDGNTATAFDAPDPGNGDFVGIDTGAGTATTYTAKLFPRAGWTNRLIGGKIQGSNNNSTWTDLATVTAATDGQWQTLSLGTTRYRYWRYLGANSTWGDIAELEFDSNGVKMTGTGFGTAGSWNNSGNTFDRALDGSTSTFFDAPDPGNGDFVGIDLGS